MVVRWLLSGLQPNTPCHPEQNLKNNLLLIHLFPQQEEQHEEQEKEEEPEEEQKEVSANVNQM